MIKNERQYRITKAQVAEFDTTLTQFEREDTSSLHALLRQAQLDALRSQRADLQSAVEEYEELKQHRPTVIEAGSLDELPRALIRARIALGLSQKELAEKMGLKEQQLQRYEATDYASASLSRIQEVAAALGVRVSESVFLPVRGMTADALYTRLDAAGIDRTFLLDRLLPSDVAVGLDSAPSNAESPWVTKASEVLRRVFHWDNQSLSGNLPLQIATEGVATARFKIPGGAHGRRLHAYIAYAHYLSMVVAGSCEQLPRSELTLSAGELRKALVSRDAEFGLAAVLHHFWDCGVPVLPLSDSGSFHGACWRIGGRNVVVVKHRSRYLARWVFDLLHEWHHAGQAPDEDSHSWIEDSEVTSTRRTSPEEQAASRFAGNVVLDGQAEALVKQCVTAAKGRIPVLKSVVPTVARQAGVGVDHLANYLGWRLSLQGENWWGTANNLQTQIGDPFAIARDVFYERFDFSKLNPIDARLLSRAMQRTGDAE